MRFDHSTIIVDIIDKIVDDVLDKRGCRVFRIGSGAGFSGDRIDAPQSVVAAIAAAGEGGAIIFETIGERTLALGHVARRTNSALGYEPLLEQFLEPVLATCIRENITVIGNFGCANPAGAARVIRAMAGRAGLAPIRIAIIEGDDITDSVDFADTRAWDGDSGTPPPAGGLIAVNAYIGARPIVEAIRHGARVVITGRVADPALVLGPLVAHFGWDFDDLDRIAAGTLAGHLLECGSQVTGGYFADPGLKDVPNPEDIGFPIAEVEADGSFVITKARGTGGVVDLRTVKEQLLYEIHDPAAYLTPDVALDITGVCVEQVGPDRVRVTGARGRPAPETLKATASFAGDWLGEAEISYAGPNAVGRARLARDVIGKRLALRGLDIKWRGDLIGLSSAFDSDGGDLQHGFGDDSCADIRVRFAFSGATEGPVAAAVQEVMALYCCGPAGGGGVRHRVHPRIRTFSRLVPRELVPASFRFEEIGQ
jgi:hypothetical protein